MKRKTQLIATISLILFCSMNLNSEESNILIKEITLTGLKRTKDNVLLQIIEPVRVGGFYTEDTEDIIIQNLRETGIFVPEIEISTDIIGNEAFINILVKDKWTLIPIPIFSITKGESWNAGILTIENNLLGFYKTLGLGFFFGSQGWTLLSFYVDPYFFQSDVTFTTSLAAGFDEVTDLRVDESIAREYQTDRLSVSLGAEYPITKRFSFGGALEYDLYLLRDESPSILPDINSIGINSNIQWKDVFYDIPYEKGLTAQLSATANWDFNSQTFYPVINSDMQWSFTPWFKHLISLKAMGGWGQMPVQKQFRLGGLDGSRVLPMDKVAADEYVTSAIIYNIPLWMFKGGTISSKFFYEAGYFKSDLIGRTLFHGPGLGLEFFINNLAIPAVGLNLGWNLETGEMQFSAGIGM
ncbi:MAG: BamA/TamA family outer membrane protein [Spirochaetaceae bacterium]|jgi:hypothetical protein|nr:BamA/TamA family outer membrane protein [Spirochaetaceae bacterium]